MCASLSWKSTVLWVGKLFIYGLFVVSVVLLSEGEPCTSRGAALVALNTGMLASYFLLLLSKLAQPRRPYFHRRKLKRIPADERMTLEVYIYLVAALGSVSLLPLILSPPSNCHTEKTQLVMYQAISLPSVAFGSGWVVGFIVKQVKKKRYAATDRRHGGDEKNSYVKNLNAAAHLLMKGDRSACLSLFNSTLKSASRSRTQLSPQELYLAVAVLSKSYNRFKPRFIQFNADVRRRHYMFSLPRLLIAVLRKETAFQEFCSMAARVDRVADYQIPMEPRANSPDLLHLALPQTPSQQNLLPTSLSVASEAENRDPIRSERRPVDFRKLLDKISSRIHIDLCFICYQPFRHRQSMIEYICCKPIQAHRDCYVKHATVIRDPKHNLNRNIKRFINFRRRTDVPCCEHIITLRMIVSNISNLKLLKSGSNRLSDCSIDSSSS